jgi:hypothetical protein
MVRTVAPAYGSSMRWDWIPLSASALVIGAMALAFGTMLNPIDPGAGSTQTTVAVAAESGRWLGMSVLYFLASVSLTLGLPSILTLFSDRARRTGALAVAVFSIGVIGTSGYAMLLVFFRALVKADAVRTGSLMDVTDDLGLSIFLFGWIVAFYAGLLLLAGALLIARRTPLWVPILLVGFVAVFPVIEELGRVGQVVQVMALAFAFTGIAMEAVHPRASRTDPVAQPAY